MEDSPGVDEYGANDELGWREIRVFWLERSAIQSY